MIVKQKDNQKTYAFRGGFGLSVLLCALCLTPPAGQAEDIARGSGDAVASVRLIAVNEKSQGAYVAGIAVAMAPLSHTYWKVPGDAGVPPVFDFAGSTNVASAVVLYPAPSRISEDGLEAFGYKDAVVFPVLVTPDDKDRPSRLEASVAIAVCGKICIPVKREAALDLPAGPSGDDEAALKAALATVPKALPATQRDDLTLASVPGAVKPTWTATWNGIDAIDDIFAEAPEGFAFDTKAGPAKGSWTLVASEVSNHPGSKWVPVTLTLAGPSRSFQTTRTLDVWARTP